MSTQLNAEMSKAMPFLTRPKNLDGSMVGDVGFDPLGFSDNFDLKWLRESELKHGRVAMLATVGFVTQQFLTIPGYEHVDDSNLGPTVVGVSAMAQIIAGCGHVEWVSNKENMSMETMFNDPGRVPGNIGFDPQNFYGKKSAEEMRELELNELKNGRLAMLAIGGMIHHNWITGEALL